MNPVLQLPVQLSEADRARIESIAFGDRDTVIKAIKAALKARSGKSWSVTGGRGTAWGWITIDALPARKTAHCVQRPGTAGNPEDYDEVDTGVPGGHMTAADREALNKLLGVDRVHHQGESIPASTDYRRVYLCRALFGHDGGYKAEPYWD